MKLNDNPTSSKDILGNSLFECITFDASKGTQRPSASDRPLQVPVGVLCVCLRGTGSIIINEKEYRISKNSIITLLPNALLEFPSSSDDFLGYAIAIDTNFVTSLPMGDIVKSYVHISTSPVLKSSEEQCSAIIETCEILRRYRDSSEWNIFGKEIAEHIMIALCYHIHALYIQNAPSLNVTINRSRQGALCQKFFELITKYATLHRDIGFYADQLCITPKYLSAVVKKASGHSPVEWIDRQVMLYARTLLTSSDMTVQQIATELNFPNPSFFGQYFKRHEGMTPRSYRTNKGKNSNSPL